MTDPFVGSLTFVPDLLRRPQQRRQQVLNSAKDKRERIGRMLLMHANSREEDQARPMPATSSRWPG